MQGTCPFPSMPFSVLSSIEVIKMQSFGDWIQVLVCEIIVQMAISHTAHGNARQTVRSIYPLFELLI